MQGVPVDLKNEYPVEEINETPEVAGAAAEERDGMTLVARHVPDFPDVPDMILVREAIERFAAMGIALVRQRAVTVNGVVAASFQLFTDRRLAGP